MKRIGPGDAPESIDTVQFRIVDTGVAIWVNGRDLIEQLREIELPLAKGEGSRSIAGGYAGLSAADVLPPSRHFMGEPLPMYAHMRDGKVPIFCCDGCGEWGCWPMGTRISITDATVTWTEFVQPHREDWDYSSLAFCFARDQYEAALRDASSSA